MSRVDVSGVRAELERRLRLHEESGNAAAARECEEMLAFIDRRDEVKAVSRDLEKTGLMLGARVRVFNQDGGVYGEGVLKDVLDLRDGPLAVVKIEPKTTWTGGLDKVKLI